TADKKVEGTGLGLSLARKFVELHGGGVWGESRGGERGPFTFTLSGWRQEGGGLGSLNSRPQCLILVYRFRTLEKLVLPPPCHVAFPTYRPSKRNPSNYPRPTRLSSG